MIIKNINIETSRFQMRPLLVSDASYEYLSWMNDEVALKYIAAAADTHSLESLQTYILEKSTKKDCLFLGVFTKINGEHIGNIKYEPIYFTSKEAVMGVLLGNSSWRGKKVFNEIFPASQQWLLDTYNIKTITLGVDKSNTSAIRAYEKAGFIISEAEKGNDLSALKMIFKC